MTRWVVVLAIVTRLLGIIVSNNFQESSKNFQEGQLQKQFDKILCVNPDELLIAEVAYNYCQGLGFVSSSEIVSDVQYNATALRPSYPVFIHIVLMSIYSDVFPSGRIVVHSGNLYFKLYAFMLHLVSLIFFVFAAKSFVRLCEYFKISLFGKQVAIVAYLLYPSVFHFVGNLACYESIALSLLIISIEKLVKIVSSGTHIKNEFTTAVLIITSTLIRPQLLIIYFFIFTGFAAAMLLNKQRVRRLLVCVGATIFLFVATAIPIFLKNKQAVGEYILSTQSGFSLFEGHNPYARGSWCGDCHINPARPMYSYIRVQVPNFDRLAELERSNELKKLAITWTLENPASEAILILRKAAIFFLPVNSDDSSFNIFNALVHILVIIGVVYVLVHSVIQKNFNDNTVLILIAPIVGSLALSEIFFVGYRWRYFCEPFLILFAIYTIEKIYKQLATPRI
jgi:hypothetical protein